MRRHLSLLSGLVLVLTVAGCSEQDETPSGQASPDIVAPTQMATTPPPVTPSVGATPVGPVLEIEIENFAFSPAVLNARPGQQITVTNRDEATHTLTANDGSIDSGDLGRDQSYTFTAPTNPGETPYICTPHPQMTGRIVVS